MCVGCGRPPGAGHRTWRSLLGGLEGLHARAVRDPEARTGARKGSWAHWPQAPGAVKVGLRERECGREAGLHPRLLGGGEPQAKLSEVGRGRGCARRGGEMGRGDPVHPRPAAPQGPWRVGSESGWNSFRPLRGRQGVTPTDGTGLSPRRAVATRHLSTRVSECGSQEKGKWPVSWAQDTGELWGRPRDSQGLGTVPSAQRSPRPWSREKP